MRVTTPGAANHSAAGRTPGRVAIASPDVRPRQTPRLAPVVAIDPGPERSAWLELRDGQPRTWGTWPNEQLLEELRTKAMPYATVVIEKVESFGMSVGADVFETVFWSGCFAEAAHPLPVERIGRMAVKHHLCHTAKAKDSNIRQALIDRYGGPAAIGRKATPGPLYGVAGDVWSALAVAVTWADGRR